MTLAEADERNGEVKPEMVAAALRVLDYYRVGYSDETLVREVYNAMRAAYSPE